MRPPLLVPRGRATAPRLGVRGPMRPLRTRRATVWCGQAVVTRPDAIVSGSPLAARVCIEWRCRPGRGGGSTCSGLLRLLLLWCCVTPGLAVGWRQSVPNSTAGPMRRPFCEANHFRPRTEGREQATAFARPFVSDGLATALALCRPRRAMNGSGWGSVEPLLPRLGADVIAVAEHRPCWDKLLAVRHRLHRNGWTFVGGPALRGPGRATKRWRRPHRQALS